MKVILLYYGELSLFNVPFSVVVGVLSGDFWVGFALSLVSGGMILAVYFYENNKEKYFFYFNKGISKRKLLVTAFILNVCLILLIFNLQEFFNG
jgi:uncharacterized membrane protein YqaE (UPF0057 family)